MMDKLGEGLKVRGEIRGPRNRACRAWEMRAWWVPGVENSLVWLEERV